MALEINKYLHEISVSIETIASYLANTDTLDDFENDLLKVDAVERRLALIGEALNKAVQLNSQLPVTNKAEIIRLRHLLVHHYNASDEAVIWDFIHDSLPVLKQEVALLLKDKNGFAIN